MFVLSSGTIKALLIRMSAIPQTHSDEQKETLSWSDLPLSCEDNVQEFEAWLADQDGAHKKELV